jgi:putative ABC transport system ATP-binding protein
MSDPQAERRISFDLHAGERVALSGPSGCGKTLLLRALAKLDPIRSGSLLWKGSEIAGDQIPFFRAAVLYLPQRVSLPEGSVEAALRCFFTLKVHCQKSFDPGRAEELLRRVGKNGDFLNKECRNLSGGESQLVALIRALLLEPEVLLLDEPTSALDPAAVVAVEELLAQWLAVQEERAYLWVTHQESQSIRVGSRRISFSSF